MLVGADGRVFLTIGGTRKATGNITAYEIGVELEKLETTTKGDEWRTYAGVVKGGSGQLEYGFQASTGLDYWTGIELFPLLTALMGTPIVRAQFYLQTDEVPEGCSIEAMPGSLWLEGDLLLERSTLRVTSTGKLEGATGFTLTGPLSWMQAAVVVP